jgi:hypothetical protein
VTQIARTFVEPFDGRTLRKWLEDNYGAVRDRQNGSHVRMKLPDGRTLPATEDGAPVSNLVSRKVVKTLGLDYVTFRRQIGHPVPVRNKGRYKPQPKRHAGKKDVIRAIAELRRELNHIEDEVATGDRDPYVYEQALAALVAAKAEASSFRTTDRVIRDAHLPSNVP